VVLTFRARRAVSPQTVDSMDDVTPGGNSDTTPPLTFEQAYAADASPASDPSPEQPAPPAAEQQGSVQESKPPQTTDDRSAYIPRSRFDEVNKRMTAAEERAQKLAWAESIDQQTLNEAVGFFGQYKGDPVDFVQQLIAQMQAHPEHGAKLRSIAARTLGTRQPQAPPPAVDMTPTAVQLEDGRTVQLYSAEQLAAREESLQARLTERFAPAMSAAEKLQQRADQAEREHEANTFATSFLADVRTLPNFKDVEPQIKTDLARMIQAGQVGDHPKELENAVRSLYLKHGLSKLTATAQSAQLDTLQHRARAATGVNPGSATPTSPRRPTSFSDPSLKW
jgi:hypothetical protein